MKKSITLLLLASMLFACNNPQHTENKKAAQPAAAQHEAGPEELVLNKGAKWKVDHITGENVKNLKAIMAGFVSGNDKTLPAYKKVDDDLQNGLEKMIRECKMQGPDHEALHKWLEPLMEQVSTLKQAATVAAAGQAFNVIQSQVNRYDQYFE
ncbi:hypothetical protein BH09BAC6_BH09BAC6_15830 [soil metagenome]|jgi:hypothetical protein